MVAVSNLNASDALQERLSGILNPFQPGQSVLKPLT
jgi:hypothetical protein